MHVCQTKPTENQKKKIIKQTIRAQEREKETEQRKKTYRICPKKKLSA